MEILLKPITKDNLDAVCKLKVKAGQKIMSNVRTIAGCYVEPTKRPLAVYDGQRLVGFAAYEREEDPISGQLRRLDRTPFPHRFRTPNKCLKSSV